MDSEGDPVTRAKKAAPAEGKAAVKPIALSIASLQQAGAFTGRPVRKEVKWNQGDQEYSAIVYVRPLGFQATLSQLRAHGGQEDGVAGRIAASICDEEGQPVFTVADIIGTSEADRGSLDGSLTVALLGLIAEVNNLGKATS